MADLTDRIRTLDGRPLRAVSLDTLMVNMGLRCNMACAHCHQSSSPRRTEQMPPEVIEAVIDVAERIRPKLVDITGGAPELHRGLRRLVTALDDAKIPIQIRSNLTALLEPEAEGLASFLADRKVRILASLPSTSADEFSAQRGAVFESAIEALRLLCRLGYGRDSRLRLDLAVNPTSDELPPGSEALCGSFREELTAGMGILFDDVVVITNVPVGRHRQRLIGSDMLDDYLDTLASEFNAETLPLLACRTGIEVAWDGTLSDCDFNLGRGLRLTPGLPATIFDFDAEKLASRPIVLGDHCLACTARAGSG